MTDHLMTCDAFDARLAEWLEDELPPSGQKAMALHAAGCAECGTMQADLVRLRADAAALPPLLPARDLWAEIASRIEAPVRALPTPAAAAGTHAARERTTPVVVRRVPRRSVATRLRGRWAATSSAWRMSAAAAALMFVTAGVTWHVARRASLDSAPALGATGPGTGRTGTALAPIATVVAAVTPEAAAVTDSVSPVAAGTASAPSAGPGMTLASDATDPGTALESTYGREITALSMLVRERRADVDSATLAVLERNLAVIDSAIAQSRAALARAPRSRFLEERLHDALDHKLSLLRRTALLPART